MPRPKKYPDELRERAVRLVFESRRPIAAVARDLGSRTIFAAVITTRSATVGIPSGRVSPGLPGLGM